ncbi:hypothetical protein OH77DRAFT_1592132 [Trametes cingulata]|nr:hypothetical protein OH77DRAFT_1592132 [Trametes cingulata]
MAIISKCAGRGLRNKCFLAHWYRLLQAMLHVAPKWDATGCANADLVEWAKDLFEAARLYIAFGGSQGELALLTDDAYRVVFRAFSDDVASWPSWSGPPMVDAAARVTAAHLAHCQLEGAYGSPSQLEAEQAGKRSAVKSGPVKRKAFDELPRRAKVAKRSLDQDAPSAVSPVFGTELERIAATDSLSTMLEKVQAARLRNETLLAALVALHRMLSRILKRDACAPKSPQAERTGLIEQEQEWDQDTK